MILGVHTMHVNVEMEFEVLFANCTYEAALPVLAVNTLGRINWERKGFRSD